MPKVARQKGVVKWFNDSKGYGFIKPDDGSKDLFVHFKSVRNIDGHVTLHEGDIVEFEMVPDTKGPRAANVDLVEEAAHPLDR